MPASTSTPPISIEDGDISRTALRISALKQYGAPGLAAEIEERIRRARDCLAAVKVTTAEDRNMQLVGLGWAGVDSGPLRRLASVNLAAQRADGGWSQRKELRADAYATGQTLCALSVSGVVSPREPAYHPEPNPARHYDVSPDGRRFLISRMARPASRRQPRPASSSSSIGSRS